MFRNRTAARLALHVLLAVCAAARAATAEPIDFARDIAPILQRSCLRCHEPNLRKGDLSLATAA